MGIHGTYYFRVVPQSYDVEIIKKIAALGHEIGHHYEDVDLVLQRQKIKVKSEKDKEELIDYAYKSFCRNLEMFRQNFDVKTICMHGSPLSPYDNKLIWSKYDYKELGIIGEPYFDLDWNEFGYLTDTGRRWNGSEVSVRDKVGDQDKRLKEKDKSFSQDKRLKDKDKSFSQDKRQKEKDKNFSQDKRLKEKGKSLEQWSRFKVQLKSTQDVINILLQNKLPDKMMFTVHPQRWTDAPLPWVKELIMQNVKNEVKRLLIKIKD